MSNRAGAPSPSSWSRSCSPAASARVTRKIKEALFAYELETKNDKDKVLVTYLNTVYFGRGAYGVESAARNATSASPTSSLDLAESATLAGIIRSPSRYGSPTSAVGRGDHEAPRRRARADARAGLHHGSAGARGASNEAARLRAEQGGRQGGAVLRRVREAGPHRHARRREGLRRRPARLHEPRPRPPGVSPRRPPAQLVGAGRPGGRARLGAPL